MGKKRINKAITKAVPVVAGLAFKPLGATLSILSEALGQPDLGDDAIRALQEDVVRLYQMIVAAVKELNEDIRSKIDPIELSEVVTQSFVNMGRTASSEKRRLMTNVVVRGVDPSAATVDERRLFVRAIADLDLLHVDVLRRATDNERITHADDDLGRATVETLVVHGFVRRVLASQPAFDINIAIAPPTHYFRTALGARFLTFLSEPDLD